MKNKFILTEYTVTAGMSGKLTLGLISDLHERDPQEALGLLRQGKPDMIMVAGDTFERHGAGRDTFRTAEEGILEKMLRCILMKVDDLFEWVFGEYTHEAEYAYQFLREAGRIAPVFLSTGNYEWYLLPEDLEIIKESRARLLDNADCVICIKGMMVRVGGLSSDADLEWLNEFCEKDGYKILLCHHPEYYDRYIKEQGIDLILSGHAHGGQIRIWNRRLYAPGQGIFPRYTRGIYDGRLIVTSGSSNTASVPRWGNPCGVVMIHLE